MLKHDRHFLENVTIFLYDYIFQNCFDMLQSEFFEMKYESKCIEL